MLTIAATGLLLRINTRFSPCSAALTSAEMPALPASEIDMSSFVSTMGIRST